MHASQPATPTVWGLRVVGVYVCIMRCGATHILETNWHPRQRALPITLPRPRLGGRDHDLRQAIRLCMRPERLLAVRGQDITRVRLAVLDVLDEGGDGPVEDVGVGGRQGLVEARGEVGDAGLALVLLCFAAGCGVGIGLSFTASRWNEGRTMHGGGRCS